ncbi:MAG TPA: hypothetical protein VE592_04490 [Geminicoccaceae bacterium]|nr:hypothetical protein [Geminicoccaceae bacterium]HZA66183.1 hypothetical protein [Geminicoccaceae bacterium]
MRWIIGIVVVVVIAILGYQYFGGTGDVDVAGQVEEGAEQAAQEVEEAAEATGQAVEEAVEGAGDTAQETTEEATTGAGQAAGEAQDTAEQAAETTRQTAEQAGETAQESAGQAADTTEEAAGDVAGTAEQATDQASEQASAATESATEQAGEAAGAVEERLTEAQTAALTVGDVNVGERLTDVLQDATASLEGVTDAGSAEAAVPALTEINTQLEDLSSTVGQLPEDAKKILADLLRGDVTELKTLADNVTSKQGVGDVLNPVLEPIMAKLDSWAQQPA